MLSAEIIRVLREDHAEADKKVCIIDTVNCCQCAVYY